MDTASSKSRAGRSMCCSGVFTWLLVQTPRDPNTHPVIAFGSRTDFEAGREPRQFLLPNFPRDFGSKEYVERRREEVEEHIEGTLQDDLVGLFNSWLEPSAEYREYLWAHRKEDVETARRLLDILPHELIRRVMRHLLESYWERYTGWPDLLVHREGGDERFFVEVKSSNDQLSTVQKNWIKGNAEELGFPFKVVKIHRAEVRKAAGEE